MSVAVANVVRGFNSRVETLDGAGKGLGVLATFSELFNQIFHATGMADTARPFSVLGTNFSVISAYQGFPGLLDQGRSLERLIRDGKFTHDGKEGFFAPVEGIENKQLSVATRVFAIGQRITRWIMAIATPIAFLLEKNIIPLRQANAIFTWIAERVATVYWSCTLFVNAVSLHVKKVSLADGIISIIRSVCKIAESIFPLMMGLSPWMGLIAASVNFTGASLDWYLMD